MSANLAALLYLVSGILFILALRGLSHPATSRQGNLQGMIGMGIAILTTLAYKPPVGLAAWALVIAGIGIGEDLGVGFLVGLGHGDDDGGFAEGAELSEGAEAGAGRQERHALAGGGEVRARTSAE